MKASAECMLWLRSYYEAMDEMRFDDLSDYLHEECEALYPGGQIVQGRELIVNTTRAALGPLDRIRHELKNAWEENELLIFELEVTYWRRDRQVLVRPGVGIFVRQDGRIRQQRLFVDTSGIWS